MTTVQFRDLVFREPFVPITIRTADGREYRIVSPEMIWIPPGYNTAHAMSNDRTVFLDIPGILAVVPDPPSPDRPAAPRGKRR